MKKLLLFLILASPLCSWGAWTSTGSICSNTSKVSGQTVTCSVGTLASNTVVLCITGWDNTGTSDSQTTNLSIDDGGVRTWTKIGEFTNTNGGAAADGATAAAFVSRSAVTTSSTVTVTSDTARIAKAVRCWGFTIGAGNVVSQVGTLETDANAGTPGSLSISSLANSEHLFARAMAYESDAGTTGMNVTTNYTTITLIGTTGSAEAGNMGVQGEFRILTATTSTSQPTYTGDTTHDDAEIFFALDEAAPPAITTQAVVVE